VQVSIQEFKKKCYLSKTWIYVIAIDHFFNSAKSPRKIRHRYKLHSLLLLVMDNYGELVLRQLQLGKPYIKFHFAKYGYSVNIHHSSSELKNIVEIEKQANILIGWARSRDIALPMRMRFLSISTNRRYFLFRKNHNGVPVLFVVKIMT